MQNSLGSARVFHKKGAFPLQFFLFFPAIFLAKTGKIFIGINSGHFCEAFVFRGHRKGKLAWNRLINWRVKCFI